LRRALHRVRSRIAGLVDAGRAQGRFRTDLPTDWLVTATIDLIHAAAADVDAGRLAADQVGWIVATTVTQALTTADRTDEGSRSERSDPAPTLTGWR